MTGACLHKKTKISSPASVLDVKMPVLIKDWENTY